MLYVAKIELSKQHSVNKEITSETWEQKYKTDWRAKFQEANDATKLKDGKSQTLSVELEILLGKTIKKFNIGEIKPDENQNMMDSFKELPRSNSTTNISLNQVNLLLCHSQLRLIFKIVPIYYWLLCWSSWLCCPVVKIAFKKKMRSSSILKFCEVVFLLKKKINVVFHS